MLNETGQAVTPSAAESARNLVRSRLGEDEYTWNLALVQRDEVLDQVRMRQLLDSLLAGYPIGSILLCRVKEDSRIIRTQDGQRAVEDAELSAWQLLDGQQRINALVSMLTTHGRYGCFYLHMTEPRHAPGAVTGRRAKDATLRHIAWQELPDQRVHERELCIDLSRWASWAEVALTADSTIDRDSVLTALEDLDPEFTGSLNEAECEVAAERLNALIRAWFRPSVPVLRAEVASPLDVLEVFTRVNLGGVQIAGADVYFAAVKTFWTDAEQHLARVAHAVPFLDRAMDALRFISRLASRGLGHGDPLPLATDRLTEPIGASLRAAMQELTAPEAVALGRVSAFSSWMQDNSQLDFALHLVTPELWDEVLAWQRPMNAPARPGMPPTNP